MTMELLQCDHLDYLKRILWVRMLVDHASQSAVIAADIATSWASVWSRLTPLTTGWINNSIADSMYSLCCTGRPTHIVQQHGTIHEERNGDKRKMVRFNVQLKSWWSQFSLTHESQIKCLSVCLFLVYLTVCFCFPSTTSESDPASYYHRNYHLFLFIWPSWLIRTKKTIDELIKSGNGPNICEIRLKKWGRLR